jgi:hypothetical protein
MGLAAIAIQGIPPEDFRGFVDGLKPKSVR